MLQLYRAIYIPSFLSQNAPTRYDLILVGRYSIFTLHNSGLVFTFSLGKMTTITVGTTIFVCEGLRSIGLLLLLLLLVGLLVVGSARIVERRLVGAIK